MRPFRIKRTGRRRSRDRSDKPEPVLLYGLDEFRLAALVTEGAPDRVDRLVQVVLFDKGIGSNVLQDNFLLDKLACIPH